MNVVCPHPAPACRARPPARPRAADCDGSCPCGDTPNPIDINSWCSQFSGWSQACCQCIVNAESGGNANAMNQNTDSSYDVGVWQVRCSPVRLGVWAL